jgi:hypothetical protein
LARTARWIFAVGAGAPVTRSWWPGAQVLIWPLRTAMLSKPQLAAGDQAAHRLAQLGLVGLRVGQDGAVGGRQGLDGRVVRHEQGGGAVRQRDALGQAGTLQGVVEDLGIGRAASSDRMSIVPSSGRGPLGRGAMVPQAASSRGRAPPASIMERREIKVAGPLLGAGRLFRHT